MQSVTTVIVDEIHALVDNKRGAHLALSLERLQQLCLDHQGHGPQRIGLSATQKPMSAVADFLTKKTPTKKTPTKKMPPTKNKEKIAKNTD